MKYRESIHIELDKRIDVSQKESYGSNSTLFQNSIVKQALTELISKYVLVPVYKATGNVAIICRRFYELTVIKKLGWTEILEMILTPMKPVIIFKKIYLLISLKISMIIPIFL